MTTMDTATTYSVLNRAMKTKTFLIDDLDRMSHPGKSDADLAVYRAYGCGHVRKMQNPLSVVKVEND